MNDTALRAQLANKKPNAWAAAWATETACPGQAGYAPWPAGRKRTITARDTEMPCANLLKRVALLAALPRTGGKTGALDGAQRPDADAGRSSGDPQTPGTSWIPADALRCEGHACPRLGV